MSSNSCGMKMPHHASMKEKTTTINRKANAYDLARLKQAVNSKHCSGYSGSRGEKEHCEAWNMKAVNPDRIA